MKIIARGRQAGKTYELIQWAKEGVKTNSYPGWSRIILAHSIAEADRIRKDGNLDYRQVFSVPEWQKARVGPLYVEVAVDNADTVLSFLIGQYPSVISATGSAE